MRNRHKTLLRDHSVPEVTPKTCPRHYSVSAVHETLTIPGPNRPPTRTGDKSNRASKRMKQEETQKQSKLFKVKSSTLYFAFMKIVLEFHKQITALSKFKIENTFKAGLSSHKASIPM